MTCIVGVCALAIRIYSYHNNATTEGSLHFDARSLYGKCVDINTVPLVGRSLPLPAAHMLLYTYMYVSLYALVHT